MSTFLSYPMAGTSLGEAIATIAKQTPNMGFKWVAPGDLHMTIGWFDGPDASVESPNVSVITLVRINAKVAPVFARSQNVVLTLDRIEKWNDIILVLADRGNRLHQLRRDLKTVLSDEPKPFLSHDIPHVRIAHGSASQTAADIAALQARLKALPATEYKPSKAALQHTQLDNGRWINVTDFEYPLVTCGRSP